MRVLYHDTKIEIGLFATRVAVRVLGWMRGGDRRIRSLPMRAGSAAIFPRPVAGRFVSYMPRAVCAVSKRPARSVHPSGRRRIDTALPHRHAR